MEEEEVNPSFLHVGQPSKLPGTDLEITNPAIVSKLDKLEFFYCKSLTYPILSFDENAAQTSP
jgi:hypothetical protein